MTQRFWTAWFRFSGCNEQPTVTAASSDPKNPNVLENDSNRVTLIIPYLGNPAHVEYQDYGQEREGSALALPDLNNVEKQILWKVKYPFQILYPHQYIESFTLQDSFFLQDTHRTFLARYLGYGAKPMGHPNDVSFTDIGNVRKNIPYEKGQQQAIDPIPSATASLIDLRSQAKLGILEGSS
jgi:hypothetical protein